MRAPLVTIGRRIRFAHILRALETHAVAPRSILDAGCGDARLTEMLARRHTAARVVGVDADPAALSRAAAEAQRLPNVELRQATVGGDNLRERFDLAVCADMLEHVADDRAALAWLAEQLQPGGVLILHVPAANQRHAIRSVAAAMETELAGGAGPHLREGYTPAQLRALASAAGLEDVKVGATLYRRSAQVAADLETWTYLHRARALKALLLPGLLIAAATERHLGEPPGNGLLLFARRL